MPDSLTKDSQAEVQYPPSILEDVAKLVQRVQTFTGATGAAIALREADEMVCRASRGSNAPEIGMVLSLDGTFTGLAVTGMKAVRCDDAENDSRVDPEISRALRIKSMAVVPVLSGMRVSGVIATFSSTGSAFSDTHMAVLKTMADGLGATIQRYAEGHGVSSSAPTALAAAAVAPLRPQAPPPLPKVEAPRPVAPPPPAPRIETRPAPPPPAPPAPKIEAPKPVAPVAKPAPAPVPVAAPVAAAAAAPAPAIEKAPEPKPQPKKPEAPKQQGKWKPVTPPKQEEETVVEKPAPKVEPKAQPKPEPKSEPKPEPVLTAPSFSYEANADGEGKKSPMIFVGVGAVIAVLAVGSYFMFGRSSKTAATPAAATTTNQQVQTPSPAVPAQTSTAATTTPLPAAAAAAKLDPTKPIDKTTLKAQQLDTPSKPAPAPMVVSQGPAQSTPKAQQQADVAPPTIAFAGGAAPTLDVPVSSSAPKLSAPAPANAVIVPSRLLQRVNPSYPQAAKQYRIEGAVSLSATIGADGRVKEAKVLNGPPMLREAAVSAVKQWKYAPSTVNGRAVESSVEIVLQFRMPS